MQLIISKRFSIRSIYVNVCIWPFLFIKEIINTTAIEQAQSNNSKELLKCVFFLVIITIKYNNKFNWVCVSDAHIRSTVSFGRLYSFRIIKKTAQRHSAKDRDGKMCAQTKHSTTTFRPIWFIWVRVYNIMNL